MNTPSVFASEASKTQLICFSNRAANASDAMSNVSDANTIQIGQVVCWFVSIFRFNGFTMDMA
jgi:hypothetical protein